MIWGLEGEQGQSDVADWIIIHYRGRVIEDIKMMILRCDSQDIFDK